MKNKVLSIVLSMAVLMGMSSVAWANENQFIVNDENVSHFIVNDENERVNIIKAEFNDISLSQEAKEFLAENDIVLDILQVEETSAMKQNTQDSSELLYAGVLNEDILALMRAAEANNFTEQQIQEYVDGLMNVSPQIVCEVASNTPVVMSNPVSTRVPDNGIGYEVQSVYGYNQATSYVTLPTRNIDNLDDIAYLFYTAYSPNTCMDFGVRGGMYSWVSSFNPNAAGDGEVINKNDGDRIYFNINVESNGWLRCRILDANNFSNVLFDTLYQMSGVGTNKMIFNKQITFCNNDATFTSGCSISHGKFDQSYLYTTTGYSIMNSSNTNPNRRGAFGGDGVTVHSYTQWGSEDVSISFD